MKISDRVLVRVFRFNKYKSKFYIKSGIITGINITTYTVTLDNPFVNLDTVKVEPKNCFRNPENKVI